MTFFGVGLDPFGPVAPPGTAGVSLRPNDPKLVTIQIAATNTAIPTTPAAMRWFRRLRSRRRWSPSSPSGGRGTTATARSARSSRALRSDILAFLPFLECRSCLRNEHAHGARSDTEDPARPPRAVAEEFGNDDRCPLPGGERGQRPNGLVAVDHSLEGVVLAGRAQRSLCRDPGSPERRPVQVQRRLE